MERKAVNAQRTVGSNHIGVVNDLAYHRPCRTTCEIRGLYKEGIVESVSLSVLEVNNRVVGVYADYGELNELQIV